MHEFVLIVLILKFLFTFEKCRADPKHFDNDPNLTLHLISFLEPNISSVLIGHFESTVCLGVYSMYTVYLQISRYWISQLHFTVNGIPPPRSH